MGKLFNTTKNGSDTFDKNLDHHNIIAIIAPKNVPNMKPINVSKHVTPKCFNKSLEDKFKNVFNIRDG